MEILLEKLLSEQGVFGILFILGGVGLYKLAKWFLGKYLELLEKKDLSFIQVVRDIANEVHLGTDGHIEIKETQHKYHNEIKEKLSDNHNELKDLIKDNTCEKK